jgi:general secretion pathway protein A
MFLPHYGFRESPFGVTPDPRFLYASATHREALASLLYGIDCGLGFMTLTATPGMGKTTLLFEVLRTVRHKAATAFIFQPVSAPIDLLRLILSELGVAAPQSGLVELQMQLNELLIKNYEAGKRFVVVIDEAQYMNDAVLEQVRMLSNFETSREKLMQIILAGQPQLAARLGSPELLQLRQRISIAARLEPFTERETAAYIRHRLTIAGYDENSSLFSQPAIEMIARYSEGIPRNINNLCFNALALGCALKQKTIGPDVLREVVTDLDLTRSAAGPTGRKEAPEWPPLHMPERAPVQASERVPLQSSERVPLSILTSDLDEPEGQSWIRGAVPLFAVLAVVIIAFGFVYVRFLRPYRGGLLSAISTRMATQPAPSTTNSSESTAAPEAKAASDDPAPSSQPAASGASEASPPASPGAVPSESAAGFSASSGARPAARPSRSVRVRRGQSLHDICVQAFKNCNSQIFREFLQVNPGIDDPSYIVPGQRIFLPPPPSSSSAAARRQRE